MGDALDDFDRRAGKPAGDVELAYAKRYRAGAV